MTSDPSATPTCDDLASDELIHRFGETFNPPGLTNHLGCVGVDVDLTAIRALSFPPLASDDAVTAALFVDGHYFPSTGAPITFRWFPDRIERTAEWDGLRLRSVTFLPVDRRAAVVRLTIENLTERRRDMSLRIALRGAVTKLTGTWSTPVAPAELDNKCFTDTDRRAIGFRARWSSAVSLQGSDPVPDSLDDRALGYTFTLGPRDTHTIAYINANGETIAEARETFDELMGSTADELARAREHWDAELEAMFTPGNDRYSGCLPTLETSDEAMRRLYLTAAVGVAYFRRETPTGRAYDTLMPRYWQTVTFLWDYHLSGLTHALLDPAEMRQTLEHWMATDIHTHFGTEWLTGAPVGNWYAVNDYAMTRMIWDYLRWTGDRDWLDRTVTSLEGEPRRVRDYLHDYVTNWEGFRTASGLADYGRIANLLECVSTYTHEVAALNAANVWSLRTAAEIARWCSDDDAAAGHDYVADLLSKEVMGLYASGKGYWYARGPLGELNPVRHAYDFATVLNTIPGDLTDTQRREMRDFFAHDLRSETWMYALSTGDPDAMFSVRPDHQWTGAYTAWPAQAAKGLWGMGESDLAYDWLRGLARSANQGPFAQAHFADTVIPPDSGGARKAPPSLPYICDWACSSNGAWLDVFIEGIFGVDARADGIDADPEFAGFDPDARLVNLNHQGELYVVDRTGIRPSG